MSVVNTVSGVTIGGNKWVRVNGFTKEIVHPTNKEFSEQDVKFQQACEKAGVKPTSRQASKYRRKFGTAYGNIK